MNAEVHVISKNAFTQNWEGNPHIHKVWSYEDQQANNFEGLKKDGFDRVVDMHVNFRSRSIARQLGVNRLTFDKLNVEKWLKVNLRMDWLPDLHLVDRYFNALKTWGVSDDGQGLEYHNISPYTGELPEKFVVLVLGAAHATKMIPKEKILEIVENRTRPVVLLGGPKEEELGRQITEAADGEVINLAGKTSIAESADIIRRSEHIIAPDTGMMHIAAALQRPISVVWGNTVPEFGMYPHYGSGSDQKWSSHQVGVGCRPCSKIGYGKCPKGHFKCMMGQDATKIWESVSAD